MDEYIIRRINQSDYDLNDKNIPPPYDFAYRSCFVLFLFPRVGQKHERRCSYFPTFDSSSPLWNENESTRTDGLSILN